MTFGLVQGMKTRTGEVVFLEDVLDEARARMLHNMSQSKSKDMLHNRYSSSDRKHMCACVLVQKYVHTINASVLK